MSRNSRAYRADGGYACSCATTPPARANVPGCRVAPVVLVCRADLVRRGFHRGRVRRPPRPGR
ncbi:hypothetical protein DSJ49_18590, partial [Mycobacterium tuberculosis]